MLKKCQPLLIIGLGPIGRFYARVLSRQNYRVFGIDRDPEVIDEALSNGEIIAGAITNEPDLINKAAVIIFNAKKEDILNWFSNNSLKGPKLYLDCGTVDLESFNKINKLLPESQTFVMSHPYILNGKELVPQELELYPDNEEVKQLGIILGFTQLKEIKFGGTNE